jgi:hypothetical protein
MRSCCTHQHSFYVHTSSKQQQEQQQQQEEEEEEEERTYRKGHLRTQVSQNIMSLTHEYVSLSASGGESEETC